MNHYTVDVLAHRLQLARYGATFVSEVTDTEHFDVIDVAYLSAGDEIIVSIAATGADVTTTIQSITDDELTVSPAVPSIAVDDEVRLAGAIIPHSFHTYKAIDPSTGEPPSMERPFIAVALGAQPPSWMPRKANVFQQPVIDRTRAAIYVEGRMTVDSGGEQLGGFDTDLLPAINLIRHFIQANPSLRIPTALETDFRAGRVSMIQDQPSDIYRRGKDYERHVFFVVLGDMTRTKEA